MLHEIEKKEKITRLFRSLHSLLLYYFELVPHVAGT